MQHPLIISYYTPDYEPHALVLKRTINRLGLRSRIELRPSSGSWVENCAQKAQFIYEIRQEVDEPVLWLDADAILRRPLHELEHCTAEFAAVKRKGWSFSGGQIYFGTGPGADLIMDIWCRYCREFPHIYDQVSLGYAWWDAKLESDISTMWLEEEIFEKVERSLPKRMYQRLFSKAAIFHKQASRASGTKRQQKDIMFTTKHVPKWWREAATSERPFPVNGALRADLGLCLV